MSDILDKYNITFGLREISGENQKYLYTKNEELDYLASFVYYFRNKDINTLDIFLLELQEIISGQKPPVFGPINDIFLEIGQTDTDFRFMDNDSPNGYTDVELSIPTEDFKDILIEWKKFVEKPIE